MGQVIHVATNIATSFNDMAITTEKLCYLPHPTIANDMQNFTSLEKIRFELYELITFYHEMLSSTFLSLNRIHMWREGTNDVCQHLRPAFV